MADGRWSTVARTDSNSWICPWFQKPTKALVKTLVKTKQQLKSLLQTNVWSHQRLEDTLLATNIDPCKILFTRYQYLVTDDAPLPTKQCVLKMVTVFTEHRFVTKGHKSTLFSKLQIETFIDPNVKDSAINSVLVAKDFYNISIKSTTKLLYMNLLII